MVQAMASYSVAVVGCPAVAVEPVRFVIVRVCWMADWQEDCLEQVVGHFEGDLFEIGVESQQWSEEHRDTLVEAVVRSGQADRRNSEASAGFGVPGQGAGPALASAALLALLGVA
jgi:hypothetical protein